MFTRSKKKNCNRFPSSFFLSLSFSLGCEDETVQSGGVRPPAVSVGGASESRCASSPFPHSLFPHRCRCPALRSLAMTASLARRFAPATRGRGATRRGGGLRAEEMTRGRARVIGAMRSRSDCSRISLVAILSLAMLYCMIACLLARPLCLSLPRSGPIGAAEEAEAGLSGPRTQALPTACVTEKERN